ncbi:MAG: hypothetical protein ACFCVG_18115, partial [Kineosporiaceae bacterium]
PAARVLAPVDRRAPTLAVADDGFQVVAWESRTGGPVEAALRRPGGGWAPARPLGGPNALAPVAAAGEGLAVVAWEGFPDGDQVVSAAVARDGRWGGPFELSPPGRRGAQPAVAADGDAVVVGWTERDPAAVVVVEITAGGPGEATRLARDGGAVSRLRLAAAGDGRVVATWLRDGPDGREVEAAIRDATGGWTAPVRLSVPGADASDPVLAGGAGTAVVAWRTADGRRGLRLVARVRDGTGWTDERQLTSGVELPRGEARSDVGSVAPAAAVGAGGTAAVVWPQRRGSAEEVRAATWTRDGGWSPSRAVSAPPGEQAGSPAVTVGPAGRVALAWESLVGDRQTVRVTTGDDIDDIGDIGDIGDVGDVGDRTGCALTGAGREASAPRLAAGPEGSVTAVWVGANRGSVETADVSGGPGR